MSKIWHFLDMIDFQHTVFGLPFAYLGTFMAGPGFPGWIVLGWVTLAMVAARTAAMCLNRAVDMEIDRRNPRTVEWAMPRGEFPIGLVLAVTVISIVILVGAAWQLNPLCLILSPLAVVLLWGYSYTKRFTWLCHLVLGAVIGIGPVGGWLAVTGAWSWTPVLLMAAVAFWIGGFDTMYACQDIAFDRKEGLHSIPARFGARGALRFARAFHTLTILFFIAFGIAMKLGILYYAGVVAAAGVLVYEHLLVKADDLSLVNRAAFHLNRYVSLVMFAMALLDLFHPL